MPNDTNSQEPGRDTNKQSHPPVPTVALPKQSVMANNGEQNSNDGQSETKKKLHWLEVGYFSSQIGLAIIGIWALTIYHGQLVVMQGQLDEMKRSGDQSTQQMWSAIGNINWEARSMDWNQKVSQKGIEASGKQAKKSLQAIQDQMRLDQRAWIMLSNVSGAMKVGEKYAVDLSFFNSGKTPAKHAIIRGHFEAHESKWEPKQDDFSKIPPVSAIGIVAPNGPLKSTIPPNSDLPITDDDFRPLSRGIQRVFVYGRVDYCDVFKVPRWITFCYYLDITSGTYLMCPGQGNDTDENTLPESSCQ